MTHDAMTTIMPALPSQVVPALAGLAAMKARSIWFGESKGLERVSLFMPGGSVTALVRPSGYGKSTFLRSLNRMHEPILSAAPAAKSALAVPTTAGDHDYAVCNDGESRPPPPTKP